MAAQGEALFRPGRIAKTVIGGTGWNIAPSSGPFILAQISPPEASDPGKRRRASAFSLIELRIEQPEAVGQVVLVHHAVEMLEQE